MGGGGGWGAIGRVKHPLGLKGQCCAFSKCHELIQSTREAQTAVRSSLVPHAVLLTHPRTMKCTLVVSQHRQKAVCKSRPGNLLSSAWCFWIVHECAYHVQAKDGFQLLCLNGRFSKIRSHIYLMNSIFYSYSVSEVSTYICDCMVETSHAMKSIHMHVTANYATCKLMVRFCKYPIVVHLQVNFQ